jgi:hypothetical protein
MAAHDQVWIKVNAPVDNGIAALVTALSEFPKLQTIESCQGGNEWAWVCFVYGKHWETPWKELADFVLGFLGPRLTRELGDRIRVSVQVTEAGQIRAEMDVNSTAISATVKLLNELRREYRD